MLVVFYFIIIIIDVIIHKKILQESSFHWSLEQSQLRLTYRLFFFFISPVSFDV